MNTIANHIGTLVRRHDYVIIPNLGGFMIQKQAATIVNDQINPPKSIVSFNHLMRVSDGLLAIEVSRAERISFREATAKIATYTDTVLQDLEDGKTVDISYLGQLHQDEAGKIIFLPSDKNLHIPTNFGLGTLHYAPRNLQAIDNESERKVIKITLPTTKSMMKYAAVAVLAVGLFFTAPKIGDAYNNMSSFTPTGSWLNKYSNDISTSNTSTNEAVETTHDEQVSDIPESIVEPIIIPKNHHVVVSAMRTEAEAEAFCKHLIKLGYSDAHILEPVKTYRIAISSFETQEQAIAYMSDLRKNNSSFSDAWVLSE